MKDILFTIEKTEQLTENVYEIRLKSEEKLPEMKCGQFLHIEVPQADLPLRRPFCLYEFGSYWVSLIVAQVGKGTKALVQAPVGTQLKAIVPIGNGFTLENKHQKVVLLGGGVGCAPLLAVPQCYPDREYYTYLGFSEAKSVLFSEKFEAVSTRFTLCTDDGSQGVKGFPTDALERDLAQIKPDVILTCGSEPMLKAVARLTLKSGIPAYMSGEARMGCGVGACLVCTCGVKQKDGSVHNMRACVDGPVFSLEDIVL